MKKIYSLAAFAVLGFAAAHAQATRYNFADLKALDMDGDMSTVMGTMTSVSRNGQYAVGSDWLLTCHSWIWKADGSYAVTAREANDNLVLAVANDGTTVGSYYDAQADLVYPGYREPNGTWHRLPQPAYAQTMNQNWKKGQYNESALPYIPTAYFVSGDGKHIGGWTYAAGGKDDARPGFDAKLHGFFWHQNESGEYILEDFADMDLSFSQQGFRPYAMNEEGTILAGLIDSDYNGIFEPAAIIDGKLEVLIPAPICPFYEAIERGYFEGSCFAVNGRYIYGYGTYQKGHSDDDGNETYSEREQYSFRYNADTKELEKLPNVYIKIAGDNGVSMGIDASTYDFCVVADDFKTVETVEYPGQVTEIFSASADFSVIAGVSQMITDWGPFNYPVLLQYDNSLLSGISPVSVARPADTLYDLQGRRLSGAAAHGIYVQNGKKVMR